MNIYLISQEINSDYGTYDSAVVVAETEEDARAIYPGYGGGVVPKKSVKWASQLFKNDVRIANEPFGNWAGQEHVTVELIGILTNENYQAKDVVCASFHAG